MKRVVSFALAAMMLFTCLTCLTSCEQKDDGAQITIFLNERIYGFDPAGDYSDDAVLAVMAMLYEPLFTLTEQGKVKGAMAKDYSFDRETGDLYITLRESYWSNGDRVTADDYVYAWQRLLDPTFQSDAAPLLYDVKNAWKIKTAQDTGETGATYALGAVAMDIETLRISFENPDVDRDAFLRNLTHVATSPVNRNSIRGQEAYWANGTASICYTNGPFSVQTLDNVYGYFTIARNEGYHRPDGSTAAIDRYVLPSEIRTLWNIDEEITDVAHLEALYDQMAASTVFYMGDLSLADRKAAKDDAHVSDALSTYSYLFNTENDLFASAEVRVILSQVIDRAAIVDLITFGKPATGLITDSVWNDTSSREKHSFRTVGGNLLSRTLSLSQANDELDRLGARRGSFTLSCLDREEDIAIATYVADLWNELGYTVTVKPVTYQNIGIDIVEGKEDQGIYYRTSALDYLYENRLFDVIALDWQMFSTNAFATLAAFSSTHNGHGADVGAFNLAGGEISDYYVGNAAGYVNPDYDALIAEAYATADLAARAEILHRAEEMLLADMPIIPLVFNQTFYVANTKLLKRLDTDYYGFTTFRDAKLKDYQDYFFKEEE